MNNLIFEVMPSEMSFTNSRTSSGPSTVDCGTPRMTGASDEVNQSTTTRCRKRVKNGSIHPMMLLSGSTGAFG